MSLSALEPPPAPPAPAPAPRLDDPAVLARHLAECRDFPAWLLDLKREAAGRARDLPAPQLKDEAWRFANLSRLTLDGFSIDRSAPSPDLVRRVVAEPDVAHAAARLVFLDDALAGGQPLPAALAARGVLFLPLREALRSHGEIVRAHLFSRLPDIGSKKFEALHAALFQNGTFLYVPRGVEIEHPLVAAHWTGECAGSALFPHTLVVAEDNARVTLIDLFRSARPDTSHFVCGVADVYAGPGARVSYKSVQDWNRQTVAFHLNAAGAERDAALKTISVHTGSLRTRHEQHCRVLGAGAGVDMDSLVVAQGQQEIDQRTLQTHSAPHGRSDLLFKNVLRDEARTIFSGLIRVDPVAQKTDAYQSNRNLLLSERADANSLPGLEIQANDVRCSHGATIGELEDEQLFYLRARGIPRRQAQELLVFGFFEEIIGKIENPELAEYVRQLVQRSFAS